MASRVVRVRSTDDGVAAHTLRDGDGQSRRSWSLPGVPRRRREGGGRRGRRPPAARARPHRHRVRHHRPRRRARPRPGAAPRTRRRRLPRALRDRRPGRVRHPRRPGRPRGQPPRGDALRGGLQGAASTRRSSPRTPGRCCPTRSARRCCGPSTLDATGEGTDVTVERALVRSRAQLTYDEVQKSIDDGAPTSLRPAQGGRHPPPRARGPQRRGLSAAARSRRSTCSATAGSLEFRSLHPVEQWNAQISLLTGMGAAHLMV